MKNWKTEELSYDFVVCGGGLAGVCAAISAARQGLRVGLLQDRTVLGGNSSSEVRVTPHGAAQHHPYGRETGIISELLIEERAVNHAEIFENGWTNSVWDLVLLSAVYGEPNIDLHLNTKVITAHCEGPSVSRVEALVLDSETRLFVQAPIFLDATGDGLVAAEAGCTIMTGSEGKELFDEPSAPDQSSSDTMGNSILFKSEDIGRPVEWAAPRWAKELKDPHFFYSSGRIPNDPRGGFWWIELGIPRHTIYDNRSLRRDLQAYTLGVWGWMKNHDEKTTEQTRNRMLDWCGSVLGTRESRRVLGLYVMKERDIQQRRVFRDEVAYGGWFLDLHTPGGMLAEHSEENSASLYNPFTEKAARGFVGPYGIPLSCLIAKDMDNLFLAGRDISASHVALGTMRVMGTTALMGEAVGTAAAVALERGLPLRELPEKGIGEIQQRLLRSGVWLPNAVNDDPRDLARSAEISADSEDTLSLIEPDQMAWAEQHDLIDLRINPSFLERTDTRMAQPLATDGSLRRIGICLSNHGKEETDAELLLFPCGGIYDYSVKEESEALGAVRLAVKPGTRQWLYWDLPGGIELPGSREKPRYLRLDLLKNRNLQWHQARTCIPGHPALYEVGLKKMRKLQHGVSLAIEVSPPQRVFGPSNVTSGVSRHHDSTHLWRSSPDRQGAASLCLRWESPREIKQVNLTFPGNLLRSYHAYHPFYRAPETAKDYRILFLQKGTIEVTIEVEGNYQRKRDHLLDRAVMADEVRIEIIRTNGDPAAGLFEVRVYGPSE